MMRIRFSNAVVGTIERRATDLRGRKRCEICGRECLSRADYEIDHCVAEGTRIGDRLPLSASDGQLACLSCHDKKTKRDVFEIARAKRLGEKHRVVGAARPTEIARRFGVKQEPNR